MALTGKGFFIWLVKYCNGGDIESIVADAVAANLTHVLIKISDGVNQSNMDRDRNLDLVAPLAALLKSKGIEVWGWHYLRGTDPVNEARVSYQRIKELSLDGFVANAEWEFKAAGMDLVATEFMQAMRRALPNLPMALSSYRFPTYHPNFPYSEFLEYCDYNMPQVYWLGAHNPVGQLTRCIQEYQNVEPQRPIIPTGSVFEWDGWASTNEDVVSFLGAIKDLGIPAVNFWSWDACRNKLPEQWNIIRDFDWVDVPEAPDVTENYISALNAKDILKLATMYTPDGVHINAKRTIQGTEKILTWFNTYLEDIVPNRAFTLTSKTGARNSRHFAWEAISVDGSIIRGKDTFGLRDGKISYHFTHFA